MTSSREWLAQCLWHNTLSSGYCFKYVTSLAGVFGALCPSLPQCPLVILHRDASGLNMLCHAAPESILGLLHEKNLYTQRSTIVVHCRRRIDDDARLQKEDEEITSFSHPQDSKRTLSLQPEWYSKPGEQDPKMNTYIRPSDSPPQCLVTPVCILSCQ